MTYNMLEKNSTSKLVSDLLTANPDTATAVYRGLTKPNNIQLMITNPDDFLKDLCKDLAGMY